MRGEGDRFCFAPGWRALIAAIGAITGLAGLLTIGIAPPAQALPSFARQTGQPCGACHTDFPALTPYGRRFKLLGYTTGGGPYRTTPFSTSPADDPRTQAEKMGAYAKAVSSGVGDDGKEYVPPISMMAVVGFTHTQASLAPPTAPLSTNDNTVVGPLSGFWGGAITENIGAFAQVTYTQPGPGPFGDQFGHNWGWDNTDIRFAKTTNLAGLDVIYGITANNNPTVQDVWNTTPAWSFPYASSTVANTPSAGTLIEQAFAAHVVGVGAYTFINDKLYLELAGYRTLDFRSQNALGADPFDAPGLFDGTAPYWRIAFEPQWGPHSLMVGTFGMYAKVNPWIDPGFVVGSTGTLPQSDKFLDTGFDSQYQYQGSNFWLTLRGSYIREYQKLDASFPTAAANPTNLLNSLHLQASLAYGGDNRFVFTAQYFDIWGTSDPVLYAGLASGLSPNSNGFVGEVAYIPFGVSQAPGWPWANVRLGLQYTYYNKFDGTTVGAHDNNTLFLYSMFAM